MATSTKPRAHGQTRAFLPAYKAELEQLSYAPATIVQHLRALERLDTAMAMAGVAPAQLTLERALALVPARGWRGSDRGVSRAVAKRFCALLVTLGTVTPPPPTAGALARAALREGYERYLRGQRGLSERTVKHTWGIASRFLDFRFGDAIPDYEAITAADVSRFILSLTTRKAPFRDKTPPTYLRNFLLYLFKANLTRANLAPAIPSVAQRYGARLPRHLSAAEVQAVIDAMPAATARDRRDRAIVLLMARLGLRSQEVVALRLEDVDWRRGELLVRGKGARHDRLPLPADAGQALAGYLRDGRVSADRALFVSCRAPHRPFRDGQVINAILIAAFSRAGVARPTPYVGSHVLRHSLAVNLLRQGAPLEEVGDVLRHRARASTAIYARLDVEALRSVAQPWPGEGVAP